MRHLILLFAAILPAQALDVPETIKRFYVELDAPGIRGLPDAEDTKKCSEMLTPGFKSLITEACTNLDKWIATARAAPPIEAEKLPFTEGALFTGVYEGGTYLRTESVEEVRDRAYVVVRIRMNPLEGNAECSDLVILHKRDGEWKIDDILSGTQSSVRSNFVVPLPPESGR